MRLISVNEQINTSNTTICKLIEQYTPDERGFLSQNILSHLRTFVEAVVVKAAGETNYNYEIFQNKGKPYLSARGHLKFLRLFHRSLQKTVSHYLPTEENSERLMLKYYEYLLKIKNFLQSNYQFEVLQNISSFPIHSDPALDESPQVF
ncbi:hypothetical protein [Kangiella shandongensis]|uniref:hypothetical protein n=1 Tax=Kangiella shandongensis TaxID=2763258 RepID=UPI001CBC3450|nr:hypothetical protein [Kangiella shandongensis]